MNMIVVQLAGGLGNQLFQYATGRALSHRKQVDLKLDISILGKARVPRTYRLNPYNIAASVASPEEVTALTHRFRRGIKDPFFYITQRFKPYYEREVIREQQLFQFDPNIFKVSGNVYLIGYWQSESYFKEIQDLLRAELTVKQSPDETNQAISDEIRKTGSVSLHIRRGDYVTDPTTAQIHGVCSINYYLAAVEKIAQQVKQPHFFVFSDDIAWARQNLKIDFSITFIDHNGADKDYEDLRLMSQCQHHIIANSSFSWWGAWLSDYPAKSVIAPAKWYDTGVDTKDLLPASWTII